MTKSDSPVQDPQALEDTVVVGSDGSEIGSVGQVYTDNETAEPTWVTVRTGWFGGRESFIPLSDASFGGDAIRVPYDKDMIKGAPHNDAGEPLSASDEDELYSYYGLTSTAGDGTVSARKSEIPSQVTPLDSGDFLTRSEEQLHIGTERVQTGRARLRKVVVTEMQTVTVPVTREEVRVVREPITPGESVDATIGESATDVVLTEERVVVRKETVPVEKVRLNTETVTEQREVTEAIRKEQIEFDDARVETDPEGNNRTELTSQREDRQP